MEKLSYSFYEKDGSLDRQIGQFLRSRHELYVCNGPTLKDARFGEYEVVFVWGNDIPDLYKDLTKHYKRYA